MSVVTVQRTFSQPTVVLGQVINVTYRFTNPNPTPLTFDFGDNLAGSILSLNSSTLTPTVDLDLSGATSNFPSGQSWSVSNAVLAAGATALLTLEFLVGPGADISTFWDPLNVTSSFISSLTSDSLTLVAELTVTRTFDPICGKPGDAGQVSYKFVNTSASPIPLNFTDTIPLSEISGFVSSSIPLTFGVDYTFVAANPTWFLFNVSIPALGQLEIVFTITLNTLGSFPAGPFTPVLSDPAALSYTSSELTVALSKPLLGVQRTFIPGSGMVGDSITVQYVFTNQTPAALSLLFKDTIPFCTVNAFISSSDPLLTYSIGPNGTWEITSATVPSALSMGTLTVSLSLILADPGTIPFGSFTPDSISPGSDLYNTTALTIEAMVCVAQGSQVSLADGSRLPIESLQQGMLLLDYNRRPAMLQQLIRLD